jgi:hypothetical protein
MKQAMVMVLVALLGAAVSACGTRKQASSNVEEAPAKVEPDELEDDEPERDEPSEPDESEGGESEDGDWED